MGDTVGVFDGTDEGAVVGLWLGLMVGTEDGAVLDEGVGHIEG